MFAKFNENFNIFLFYESKLDAIFPNNQYHLNRLKTLRCDRNRHGGGLILYVHKSISCKPLKIPFFGLNIEIIALEFHQIKRKWLFMVDMNPTEHALATVQFKYTHHHNCMLPIT